MLKACALATISAPQVLLAWSGGPSSSSMVWQVLEVRLHYPPGPGDWAQLGWGTFLLSQHRRAVGWH